MKARTHQEIHAIQVCNAMERMDSVIKMFVSRTLPLLAQIVQLLLNALSVRFVSTVNANSYNLLGKIAMSNLDRVPLVQSAHLIKQG